MKTAIRLAVVVMMVGASTAAFARAGDPYDGENGARGIDNLTPTKFETASPGADEHQDMGHGSGEPGSAETMTKADEATAEKAAVAEYNQRNFLAQTWSAP